MATPAPEYEMIYLNEHRDETIGGLLIGLAVPRRSRASLMENTFILRSSKRRDGNDAMLRRKWLDCGVELASIPDPPQVKVKEKLWGNWRESLSGTDLVVEIELIKS